MSSKSNKTMPKELTEEQIKFWLANTNLSREQLIDWYKSFVEFSQNNDKLDQENFTKFFDKLQHKGQNAQTFYKLAFKTFDKDNSGAIDFHEFLLSFNILSNGNLKDRLNWIFNLYDQNKNNSIDKKEITVLLKAILQMNKKELTGNQATETKIDEIFEKLDDNENDQISREEFLDHCTNNIFLRDILAPEMKPAEKK